MGKSPRLIFASGMLLLAVLACNLPSSQSSSQPDLAATITAQAMLLETPTSTSESQTQTPAVTGLEVSVSATTTPPVMAESQTNTPKPTKTPIPTKTLSSVNLTATMFTELPAVPTNLSGSRTCAKGLSGLIPTWKETYTLTWTDNATNETGYHIGQNGSVVADIPANSTRYSNTFQYKQGFQSKDLFFVLAYNSAGYNNTDTASEIVWIPRCP